MSSAVIIRNARRRAGLTQTDLAERLGKTQSEIGRWERGEAKPSFETLQRVVRACGLELTVQVAVGDDSYVPQIDRMLELSPRERVERAAAHAAGLRRMRAAEPPPIDPLALLEVLARHGVQYVLIGGVAANVHGCPLPTENADITPDDSPGNRRRLAAALHEMDAPSRVRTDSALAIRDSLTTDLGDLDLVTEPAGTGGYKELRRDAREVDFGESLRVAVASLPDLIRTKEAAGRPKDLAALPALRATLERLEEPRS